MYTESLENSFPASLKDDVKFIESNLDLSSKYETYEPFKILFKENTLIIPLRVYVNVSQLKKINKFTKIQKDIVYCFYSRHHDGFIRERCLKKIFDSENPFVIPYIVQLLGEYVIEIIEVIYKNREKINKKNLISYLRENPEHYEITKQRVISYWDCYYRMVYPKYKKNVKPKDKTYLDYPGIKMVKYINVLLSKT